MQQANPIRRGFLGEWAFLLDGSEPTARRNWYAICPDCGERVQHPPHWPNGAATRKNTKDALYRHRRKHRPGLVGR